MVIFHCYVKLPEGIMIYLPIAATISGMQGTLPVLLGRTQARLRWGFQSHPPETME